MSDRYSTFCLDYCALKVKWLIFALNFSHAFLERRKYYLGEFGFSRMMMMMMMMLQTQFDLLVNVLTHFFSFSLINICKVLLGKIM